MSAELKSLDLVLRLLHVDGLGHSPNLVDVDRESARRLLANRFELPENAPIDDVIAWFLMKHPKQLTLSVGAFVL